TCSHTHPTGPEDTWSCHWSLDSAGQARQSSNVEPCACSSHCRPSTGYLNARRPGCSAWVSFTSALSSRLARSCRPTLERSEDGSQGLDSTGCDYRGIAHGNVYESTSCGYGDYAVYTGSVAYTARTRIVACPKGFFSRAFMPVLRSCAGSIRLRSPILWGVGT